MKRTIQIFKSKPDDFHAKVHVAAAYIEINGKILLLQLSEKKAYAKCWGVPAGKFEEGETPDQALRRELYEETGISLAADCLIYSLGNLYMRKPEIEYVYHPFKIDLKDMPEIILSDEHIDYKWVTIDEAKKLDLIDGAEDALKYYLSFKEITDNTP